MDDSDGEVEVLTTVYMLTSLPNMVKFGYSRVIKLTVSELLEKVLFA